MILYAQQPPEGYYVAPHVTVREIQEAVCAMWSVRQIDMLSQRRDREISLPRQVAMYLCRELTPYSLPNIGRFFGGRDHTTVMHAIKAVRLRQEDDLLTRARVNRLIKDLSPNNLETPSGSEFLVAA